jgi:cytosine/adenosine deaminase-related metal-dependent hydrolase
VEAARPSVREIRNLWLCRFEDAVRTEFCDLRIQGGRIAAIRPADYRGYLRKGLRERSPAAAAATAAGRPAASGARRAGEVREAPAAVLDAAARVATPPMVNFHEHFYSRLARGLAPAGPTPEFRKILESLWWRLDQALDGEMVEACARLGCAEALASGATYIFDHHSSPSLRGSLELIGAALSEARMRGVLCLEASDRHDGRTTAACLEEQRAFLSSAAGPELRGLVGLHAPFTLTDGTLQKAAVLCSELEAGIHMHLAEDAYEQRYSRATFGCGPAERLQRAGLLRNPGILAHGVHLAPEDWEVLSRGRCALALNPDSNLNNAVGLGRYTEIPGEVPLVAGTDGMHASPSRSIKQLFLLHRHQGGEMEASFGFVHRLHREQLRFARRFFPDYPALHTGERADLVIWDYRPPSPFSDQTFWGHLVYGILEARAWSVFMAGEALLAAHEPLRMDFESVARSAAIQGRRLFEKLGVIRHGRPENHPLGH